jgi:hypothetical protein
VKTLVNRIVNAIFFAFGRCRVRLANNEQMERVLAAIKSCGGKFVDENYIGFDTRIVYFRPGKRRITMTIMDDGDVFVSGSRQLVGELTAQIAA